MPGLGWSQEQLKSLDRTLGQRQGGGLRPVTPSLPETDDERAARIKRDSLLAIMSMPEPLRSQQLAGAQYEPGVFDYLNQGAGSFMRALGTGIGALPKAGAVAVDAVNRLVPIYVPGVSSASNSVFDSPAYHYGEDVAKRIGDVGPLPVTELQDSFVATTFPSAAASVATTALPALIPGVGPAIGAASGAAQQSVSELERAVKDGQTESEALGAFIPNALIGVSDIIPGMVARKALTGAATRELGGSLLGSTLRAAGKAGVTEGAQEFGQNIASDVVSGYRPIDIPGALEAGAAGLITGGALGGGANIAGRAIGRLTPLKPSQQDGMVTSPTISEKIELTPDQMANLARKNAYDAGLTRSPQSVAQDFGLQTPDQQQNFANKNAYDAGLSRNPTDVAQTLELPANAHLVNEQGAPIEQASTPPLVQTPPITARPASNLPAIDAPADVLRQDVPDISKVAAARIQNLAETKPLADGRVTRLAPLNTPVAEIQRYYESYGVPFHARREGLGWRLTIDPLAQTREQALDPRDVMDQINYAAEQGIRQRGVPNDRQSVRGPDAIAPEVQPAVTEPVQPPVQPEPQAPQAQAQDPQVLKDELSTLAAKTRRGLLLARDRRTIPQRMAQLQNTLINDYAIDLTEIDAIVGGEPITPRVPISEITNEGQTVPTEVQQSGQGQIQQANAAETPSIEGGQVGQDVRLQLTQPTIDSTLGPGGQTGGIPAPQPKGNLFQRSRNRLARAAAQQELAAQQQIAAQQTEQATEQPAETVQQTQDRLGVPQEDRQRIASVTESLPENQRDAAAIALTEGRPSDISTITATPEDVSQAANISTFAEPDVETATVSLPEPDTEVSPDTPIETKLVSKDEANAAFKRLAGKFLGSPHFNPIDSIFDKDTWADITKIALHYSEYYARAGLAGAQSGYRAFAKYMRNALKDIQVEAPNGRISLGDHLVTAYGGADLKRLYAETKSKLVRERKALAGSLQRQRVAASDALKAQGIVSSISRNLSKLKETKLHSGFKDMLKQAGISFVFTKSDRLGDRLSMYSAAVERAIGDRIDPVLIRQLNQNEGKLSNLSVSDLAQINNVLKSFKKLNSDFATDVAGSYINVRNEHAANIIKELNETRAEDRKETAVSDLGAKLRYAAGTLWNAPYTMVKGFVAGRKGTALVKLLYHDLIDAERKALKVTNDHDDHFDSLVRQHKMRSQTSQAYFASHENEYVLGGQKIRLTEAELADLHMIAQSPEARERVLGSSFVREKDKEISKRNVKITEEFLNDVEKQATPFIKDHTELAFAEKAEVHSAVNAAVKATTGREVGHAGDRYTNLTPTKAQEDSGLPTELIQWASERGLEREGFVLPRQSGDNVYVIGNGIAKHAAYMKKAADIAYKLVPGRMAMAVLEKPDVRETLVSKWDSDRYKALIEQTKSLSGLLDPERTPSLQMGARWIRSFAHTYASGRLIGRLTSIAQQASGLVLAMAEMTPSEVLHTMAAAATRPLWMTEATRAIMNHNEYLRFRVNSGRGRGLHEPSTIGEYSAAKNRLLGVSRDIRDVGFKGLNWGDNQVMDKVLWGVIGANPRNAGESDAAYYARIGNRVEHIIRITQNPVLPSDMTLIQRSSRKTVGGPLVFMLTSSSAAARNVYTRAVQERNVSKALWATASLASATAISTLHGLAVYGIKGDDDEARRIAILKRVASRFANDVAGVAIPGLGDSFSNFLTSWINGIVPDDRSPFGAVVSSGLRWRNTLAAENPRPGSQGAAMARFFSNLAPIFGVPSYPLEVASGIITQMSAKHGGGSGLPGLKGSLKGGQLKGLLGG